MLSVALLALMGQAVQAASDEKHYLSVDPFYIEPGEVVTVNLNLVNEEEICIYQTDLVLPEGLSVTSEVEDGETFMNIDVVPDRTSNRPNSMHSIEAALQKDGSVKILSMSLKNVAFKGNSGAVATISLLADESLQAGVYELALKNSELTLKETLTAVNPATYTTSVVVGSCSEGILTLAGEYTTETIGVLNTVLAEKEDITIVDMTKVVAFDGVVAVTNNPNALIYTLTEIGVTNENNVVVGGVCNNLVLTDGYPFAATSDFTISNGTYNRTLSAGKYGTVVLPFEIDDATKADYEFYTVKAQNGDYLQFELVDNPTSGTPYLYINKGETVATGFTAASGSTVSGTINEQNVIDGWQMKATYSPINITDATVLDKTYYVSNNKLMNATSSLSIAPFRAYLEGPSYSEVFASSAKSIAIHLEGTTEIVPIEAVDEHVVYDLTGRLVANPSKGLYIVNGKKFYNR